MNQINPFQEPETIVLGNGEFPSAPHLLHMLQQAATVACCDGAADKLLAWGRVPSLIVGDGDSLSATTAQRLSHLMVKVAEQATNDQTKTVHYLHQQGVNQMAILGATGGRDDHAMGNISLLMDYMEEGLQVRMFTNDGVFVPICADTCFASFPRQQVSIFNFGATHLTSEGLQYPLYPFKKLWQGTLNQVEADRFILHTDGPLLVFLTHKPK